MLSKAEANRAFALPLSDGRVVKMDFATLKPARRNDQASRAEFQSFYDDEGFKPLAFKIVPPSPERLRLGEALFRQLDRDGNGKLTAAELAAALRLLRRLDENEDEVLVPSEILSKDAPPVSPTLDSPLNVVVSLGESGYEGLLRCPFRVKPLQSWSQCRGCSVSQIQASREGLGSAVF